MASMDSTSDIMAQLVASVKRYLGYQKKYIKLDLTEKLTILLTALILGAIIFVIGTIAVIFLALTVAAIIETWTGSAWIAYGIVTCLFIILCIMLYLMRDRWIVNPLTQFFSAILLDDPKNEEHEEDI